MAIASKTKNVAVYNKLRQSIIKGKLKPGQKVVMAELAKAFGLSETPVREAIRRLESEGYIDFTPHMGAIVTKIDEGELVEIYLIRIALEELATRLASPHITEKDIDFLNKKNSEMEMAIQQNRYEILAAMNKAFHLRIYKAAPFPRLYKMICDLWDTFERWPSVFAYVPERAAASVEEHKKIIQALRAGDMEQADRLIKEQKERTMEALQKYMAQSY
ncbi:MAG: GntR family transcriptional regulator [Deltaproteobacteria bacterium]|nr:MAG: GntR family transcriptional regulator [Deltaproteobacteria bacterium]